MRVEYETQFRFPTGSGEWRIYCNWKDDLESAKEQYARLESDFPLDLHRIIKRTIIEEVVQ